VPNVPSSTDGTCYRLLPGRSPGPEALC